MSSERLREELHRIAEGAPRVDIPSDLYARGRRATARARIIAAGAAVACVVLLVAVVAPALQADPTPVAGKPAAAMPDHLHAVPLHVEDRESDLTIGLGAAAFVTEAGVPVVVSAMTGEYHLLDLDGLLGASGDSNGGLTLTMDHPPVALSPDGRYLAWGWIEPGPSSETRLKGSGVRVADLETGAVREIDVIDSDSSQTYRVLVNQVSWSPDGRWLAWGGTRITEWTSSTFNSDGHLAGTVRTNAGVTTMTGLPEPTIEDDQTVIAGDAPFLVAVANTGELTALSGNLWWQIGNRTRLDLRSDQRVGSLWFEGEQVFVLVTSATGGEVATVRALPDGPEQTTSAHAPRPRMLGALDDGSLLLHQESLDGDDGVAPTVELVTLDARTNRAEARTIIDVDPGVLRLSLATDLIDPDRPTVSRPAPDWPSSNEREAMTYVLVVFGLVLLGGLVAVGSWLRRRVNSR